MWEKVLIRVYISDHGMILGFKRKVKFILDICIVIETKIFEENHKNLFKD